MEYLQGNDGGGTESAAPQTRAGSPETGSAAQRMLHNEKTQTPLITIAAAEYVRLHGDKQFAAEVLPALMAYDDWLWRQRTDSEGRFILWHGDESGWDNATRHYPVPAKPFDVQVHCLLHRMALSELAGQVGSEDQLAVLRRRINITRAALKTYWCDNDRWYYDFGSDDGGKTYTQRKQIAASGLFSLLATGEQRALDACLNALQHPKVFGTQYPVPTLAACDPDYAPHGWGWNGPAWLQVNYFTICGLLKARQYSAAFELWEKTRALIIRDGQPASYELYDPELGTGMGCPDYSWQAMVNNLVITRFAGVTPGSARIAPALPPGIERLRISGLPGMVREVALTRLGFQLKLRVEFQTAQLPTFDLGGLGRIEKASIEDLQLKIKDDGRVVPPDELAARRSWEVAITCR
jgi:glycogen debranching enzyme